MHRDIRPDECRAAAQLFVDALTALTQRVNAPPPPPELVDEEEAGYAFVAKSGIFRVATIDERIVTLACAIVRDDQWFLSGFWADPALRGQGIGGPLLREVWEEGTRRGCRARLVWASVDPTAIASYLKLGMLPGSQLLAFAGAPRVTAPRVEIAALTVADAAAIDRVVRGVPRDVDHAWWLSEPRNVARVVRQRGRALGYYYAAKGRIGPVAWLDDADGETVFTAALAEAASQAAEAKVVIPGMNHTAIRLALAAGLRYERNSHLLWTEPIGQMERYVPSGPLLF